MYNKLIASSSNPRKLSLTVQGFLLALLPIAISVFGLTEAELQPIVEAIVAIVFSVASVVSAAQMLFGLLRKLYNRRWSA